jgi:MFS family permease
MPTKDVTEASLWKNRSFVRLFAAQVISLLGSGATTVGLALFAHRLTGGPSATAVIGNALTLRIVAFMIFSQPAGVLADRVNRKMGEHGRASAQRSSTVPHAHERAGTEGVS